MTKKVVITAVIALVVVGVLSYGLFFNIPTKEVKIGVIDASLSVQSNNVHLLNDGMAQKSSHADMVVDIIRRECENSKIYLANVLDENNTASIETVVDALDWLKQKEVDIICMSFATTKEEASLKEKIYELKGEGIVLVAACINYSNVVCYPANYQEVISVANCKNGNATIEITDKATKDYLKSLEWKESGTSALNAYITGKIAKRMSLPNFNLDDVIHELKKLKK